MFYLKDERDKSNMKPGSEVEDMRLWILREMRQTKKVEEEIERFANTQTLGKQKQSFMFAEDFL